MCLDSNTGLFALGSTDGLVPGASEEDKGRVLFERSKVGFVGLEGE